MDIGNGRYLIIDQVKEESIRKFKNHPYCQPKINVIEKIQTPKISFLTKRS
jgi:hypothetical protein